jgi:uncharacterized hydrophobic protein (TIGR00271 family)
MLVLFALAGMIAGIGVLLDSAPIVVGAIAVSPTSVRSPRSRPGSPRGRSDIAGRGLKALLGGFAVAVLASFLIISSLAMTGVAPQAFHRAGNALAEVIAAPDWYSVIVAILAGAAGMISVLPRRSVALTGVAISITTIPAAAAIGLWTAYGDWSSVVGSAIQLGLNIAGLLLSSTLVLAFSDAHFR